MIKITINGSSVFDIDKTKEGLIVNHENYTPDLVKISEDVYHLLLNNKSYRISVVDREDPKHLTIEVNGNRYRTAIQDQYDLLLHELGMDAATGNKAEDVKAPMPGLVLDVLVEAGQEVEKDTPLIILEAMKMENVLKATAPGVVDSIQVKQKDAVEKGQILIRFK
jgi:biotin carboxyl carrier protein